jgi:hypothetical protein
MSSPIIVSDILERAEDLAGTNSRTKPGRGLREFNRSIRWVWKRMATGFEGFATLDTEIDSPATGTTLSILAGQGGAGTDPAIVRGVFQVRALYRPLSPNTINGERDRATFMTSTTWRDRYGVAPTNDERDRISRPGVYWYRQGSDGTSDLLHLRPRFNGIERLFLTYTPTAPQATDESETIEGLNDAEEVIAHYMAYGLTSSQDPQKSANFLQAAKGLRAELIDEYRGSRDVNGPDAVDRYRVEYRGGNVPWRRSQ